MREGQVHTSPWFSANITAPSTALSKKSSSASATDSKNIFGLLPPSSIVTGIRFSEAYCMISLPVVVSPVNATLFTLGELANGFPASGPNPVTTFSTPFGRISPTSSIRHMMPVGVCSAGLTTTVHPAASAGAIFHAAISKGKFHGMICPTTPIGSCRLMLTVVSSCSLMDPSSLRITPAK